jgi:hypothetical protein
VGDPFDAGTGAPVESALGDDGLRPAWGGSPGDGVGHEPSLLRCAGTTM